MRLLNVDKNVKTVKGQASGYLTAIMYLAPARLSGFEVCAERSPGCTEACLNTAGRGKFTRTQLSRILKTQLYFRDRDLFMEMLYKEICALERKAGREGLTPVVRLNGTSDIPWERVRGYKNTGLNIMEMFPHLQFYDYTKIMKRAVAFGAGEMPDNYHLTFSLTEVNDKAAFNVLKAGTSVAVVFNGAQPGKMIFNMGQGRLRRFHSDTVAGWDVVDGDKDDLRFNDPRGVIVGLKAKGKAKTDTTGFVR